MVALAHKLPALTLSPAVKLLWSKRALKNNNDNKKNKNKKKHQTPKFTMFILAAF